MTKKVSVVAVIVFSLLMVVLVGCSGGSSDAKCSDVISNVIAATEATNFDTVVSYGEEVYTDNFERLYNFDISEVNDGVIAYGNESNSADEISMVHAKNDDGINDARGYLQARIQKRMNDFTGYFPDEVDKLERARVIVQGQYVIMIVCDDVDSMETAIRTELSK
ncbi:MAG TPA: DUF4358 domain-containing protein [Anaerovoracaceae bacterium]|nr:DUF4358 domain-containing protein [Anaerovoracaceae bacterium]